MNFDINNFEREQRLELLSIIKERMLRGSCTVGELSSLLLQWENMLMNLRQVQGAQRAEGLYDFEKERARLTEVLKKPF
jgi:hypothetical protein